MSEFDTILEMFANLCHNQWSNWMTHLFKFAPNNADGSYTISAELVERWTRQMHTSYSQLSDEDQLKDIREAHKFLALMAHFLLTQTRD